MLSAFGDRNIEMTDKIMNLLARQLPSYCVQYTTLNYIVKKNLPRSSISPLPGFGGGGKIVVKTK